MVAIMVRSFVRMRNASEEWKKSKKMEEMLLAQIALQKKQAQIEASQQENDTISGNTQTSTQTHSHTPKSVTKSKFPRESLRTVSKSAEPVRTAPISQYSRTVSKFDPAKFDPAEFDPAKTRARLDAKVAEILARSKFEPSKSTSRSTQQVSRTVTKSESVKRKSSKKSASSGGLKGVDV